MPGGGGQMLPGGQAALHPWPSGGCLKPFNHTVLLFWQKSPGDAMQGSAPHGGGCAVCSLGQVRNAGPSSETVPGSILCCNMAIGSWAGRGELPQNTPTGAMAAIQGTISSTQFNEAYFCTEMHCTMWIRTSQFKL